MIPWDIAKDMGVDKYLSGGKDSDAGRVRAARLRGVISHGFIIKSDKFQTDEDIEKLGMYKYEPPEICHGSGGETEVMDVNFSPYVYIENIKNYPHMIQDGEQVVVTEKIHGTNSVVGIVDDDNFGKLIIGSRKLQRRFNTKSLYELPVNRHDGIEKMLRHIYDSNDNIHSVFIYGEIYGYVQDLKYGHKNNRYSYVAFDIAINNQYLNWNEFKDYCNRFNIPMVPEIVTGEYNDEMLKLADGLITIEMHNPHIREGVVIRPLEERVDLNGRVILKVISDDYITRKGGTEYH